LVLSARDILPEIPQIRLKNIKSTFFKLIVKFGVVFMFWHDIVYIELLYFVTNFELLGLEIKLQWLKMQKIVDCTPPSPTDLSLCIWRRTSRFNVFCSAMVAVKRDSKSSLH